MRRTILILSCLGVAACDPYNYARFDQMDSNFQKYIGFHKRCLTKMHGELGLKPADKSDWHSAEYQDQNSGEHSYDVAFHSIAGTDDWVLCTIDVANIAQIKVEKRKKLAISARPKN